MLVVISVIAILMSILLPSLGRAREQSRQVVCGTNIHSLGTAIFVYAHDNDDILVPGDFFTPWVAWGNFGDTARQVNFGYLITADTLPLPTDKDSVFFCPSMRGPAAVNPAGKPYFEYRTFADNWGLDPTGGYGAPVHYMLNTSLDGFSKSLHSGAWPVLSHTDKIQYLFGDGSTHTFNSKPVVYDAVIGPELIQEVNRRYGLNFPAKLLHQWLANERINTEQANEFLNDPTDWILENAKPKRSSKQTVKLSQVSKESLVCDVVGVFCGEGGPYPPPPYG
jgi:hypothetical protein